MSNRQDIFPTELVRDVDFQNVLLRSALPSREKRKLGHVMRLSFSDTSRSKIVSMEIQSVYKDKQPYAKTLKRLIGGKDSLLEKLTVPEQMQDWKGRRLLTHPVQEKYYWSHVLAVAAATNFLDSQIHNQVIIRKKEGSTGTYDQKEWAAAKERRNYQRFPGFMIAPKKEFSSNGNQRTLEGVSKNSLVCVVFKSIIPSVIPSVDASNTECVAIGKVQV